MEKAQEFTVDCGIMEDLLPLYVDEVCTESSRQAIENHLTGCINCQQKLARMQGIEFPQMAALEQEEREGDGKVFKKSFRRIKRRWMISLVAVLLIVPLICVGVMSVNEYRKEGMCFSNLDEIATAKAFLKELKHKQYEAAAKRIPFGEDYQNIISYEYETFRDDFAEITLAGETWVVSSFYPQNDLYKGDLDIIKSYQEEDENTFWRNMIYGYERGVPIPETVWNDVVGEYTIVKQYGIDVYFAGEGSTESYNEDEAGFCRLETEWGIYYIDANTYENMEDEERNTLIQLFYYDVKIMPERVYEDVKAYMPECIAQQNAAFDDYYGDVFSMTEEEYVAEMQERFVQSMKSYEALGYSFTDISFADAYCFSDEDWCIILSVMEKNPSGEKEKISLHISVNGKQVRLGACSSKGDTGENSLGEAINVHY